MKQYLDTSKLFLLSCSYFAGIVASAIGLGMSPPQPITIWLTILGSFFILACIFLWLEGKLEVTEAEEIGKGWYRFGQLSIWLGISSVIVTALYMMILTSFIMLKVIEAPINPSLMFYPSLYIFTGLNLTSIICLVVVYGRREHLLERMITRVLSWSD